MLLDEIDQCPALDVSLEAEGVNPRTPLVMHVVHNHSQELGGPERHVSWQVRSDELRWLREPRCGDQSVVKSTSVPGRVEVGGAHGGADGRGAGRQVSSSNT